MANDAIADYYDRHWRDREQAQPVEEAKKPWDAYGALRLVHQFADPCGTVLDMGCGRGVKLRAMMEMPGVQRVIGVEPSRFACDVARRMAPGAEVHQCFGEDMQAVESGICDAVVAGAVFEHLYDVHRAFNELNRVLRSGGVAFAYTTDFNLLKKLLVAFRFESCFNVFSGHIRFFTGKSLRHGMRLHGFDRVYYRWGDDSYAGIMPKGQVAVFRKTCDMNVLETVV